MQALHELVTRLAERGELTPEIRERLQALGLPHHVVFAEAVAAAAEGRDDRMAALAADECTAREFEIEALEAELEAPRARGGGKSAVATAQASLEALQQELAERQKSQAAHEEMAALSAIADALPARPKRGARKSTSPALRIAGADAASLAVALTEVLKAPDGLVIVGRAFWGESYWDGFCGRACWCWSTSGQPITSAEEWRDQFRRECWVRPAPQPTEFPRGPARQAYAHLLMSMDPTSPLAAWALKSDEVAQSYQRRQAEDAILATVRRLMREDPAPFRRPFRPLPIAIFERYALLLGDVAQEDPSLAWRARAASIPDDPTWAADALTRAQMSCAFGRIPNAELYLDQLVSLSYAYLSRDCAEDLAEAAAKDGGDDLLVETQLTQAMAQKTVAEALSAIRKLQAAYPNWIRADEPATS